MGALAIARVPLCSLSEMGRAAVTDPDIAEYGGTGASE